MGLLSAGVMRAARWTALLLVASVAPAFAQTTDMPSWVALFSWDQVRWLENENRLDELCGDPSEDHDAWATCRNEALAPFVLRLPLYLEPDTASDWLGDLIVVAVPARGLEATFVPVNEVKGQAFVPDLYDRDWGYGPYFHQTVAAHAGAWVQLPVGPAPAPAWLDTRLLERKDPFRPIAPEEILRSPWGDVYVLAVRPQGLLVRPEQPADMWCDAEAGDPPAIEPVTPVEWGADRLFDARGHLAVAPKYLRGC